MGSRVQLAAATCLLACGLFAGGAGGALALAGPAHESGDTGPAPANDVQSGTHSGADGSHGGKPGDMPDGPNVNEPDADQQDDTKPSPTTEPKPADTPRPTQTEEPTEQLLPPTEEPAEHGNDEDIRRGFEAEGLPEQPPEAVGGGGGGAVFEPPAGRPQVPPMQLAPHVGVESDPTEPAVINAVPGVGVPDAETGLAPIAMPVVAAPPPALGGGGGAPSAPGAPRGINAEPQAAGRPAPPAAVGRDATVPGSYRSGYNEYLRTARMAQLVAFAVPGVVGILLLTAAGGLVGYRQAKAGHAVRTGRSARFVN